MDGEATEVLCCHYEDYDFIIATQRNKMGTMVWDISQICCNTARLMHFVIHKHWDNTILLSVPNSTGGGHKGCSSPGNVGGQTVLHNTSSAGSGWGGFIFIPCSLCCKMLIFSILVIHVISTNRGFLMISFLPLVLLFAYHTGGW